MKYQCSSCGETENIHFNYDYTQAHRPIKDIVCNACGEEYPGNMSVKEYIETVGRPREVVVPQVLAAYALYLSERCLEVNFAQTDMSDLGNELGLALAGVMEGLSEDDTTHLIHGFRHGISLYKNC